MVSNRGAQVLRGLAVAAVTALVPAVAGCEAGANSPTQQWHQPTPGASAVLSKTISINNVFVLGAPPQSRLAPGQSAGLFLAVANDGKRKDRLISISAPGAASAVQFPKAGISVAAGQSVLLQGPVPEVVLENLTRALGGGQNVPVTLDFENAGSVTLHVPVIPRAASYATFSPVPASPTASPSPTATGKNKRQGAATPTPTPSPTG